MSVSVSAKHTSPVLENQITFACAVQCFDKNCVTNLGQILLVGNCYIMGFCNWPDTCDVIQGFV